MGAHGHMAYISIPVTCPLGVNFCHHVPLLAWECVEDPIVSRLGNQWPSFLMLLKYIWYCKELQSMMCVCVYGRPFSFSFLNFNSSCTYYIPIEVSPLSPPPHPSPTSFLPQAHSSLLRKEQASQDINKTRHNNYNKVRHIHHIKAGWGSLGGEKKKDFFF